ncbi:hypothetical protein POKO110462_06915 [Pontibacter korlensis]
MQKYKNQANNKRHNNPLTNMKKAQNSIICTFILAEKSQIINYLNVLYLFVRQGGFVPSQLLGHKNAAPVFSWSGGSLMGLSQVLGTWDIYRISFSKFFRIFLPRLAQKGHSHTLPGLPDRRFLGALLTPQQLTNPSLAG